VRLYYKPLVTVLPPGSVFARYEIEEVAGRGGMGVVYRALDLDLDRTVALKLISAELGDNPAFRRRFQAECRIAASLDHPNVVTLFHAGEQEGRLYLVMRFVEGEDLRNEIAARGALGARRAVHIATQIASALDEAHGRGLVHRDVKPANILLAPGDHAYLTDFGLTKRLLADAEDTVTENLLGTLDYVAPEQIRGMTVDPRTDVYALGCVLFHSLSGRPPYASLEREAKLLAHISEPPPALGGGVPRDFDDVVARAMAKDPADRFESAGEVAAAARAALAAGEALGNLPLTAQAEAREAERLRRRGYRRALISRALLSPFSLGILVAIVLAGIMIGEVAMAVPVAFALYLGAAAVIGFDAEVREQVRERARPGEGDPAGPAQDTDSSRAGSARVAALLEDAATKQARIETAIAQADLPYAGVAREAEGLVTTFRQMADRAELLEGELHDPARGGIGAAQLERFYREMEKILVEFDTIRVQLADRPTSARGGEQERLEERIHDLRAEAGEVAQGIESASSDRAGSGEVESR
jgi:Protein kinase domain